MNTKNETKRKRQEKWERERGRNERKIYSTQNEVCEEKRNIINGERQEGNIFFVFGETLFMFTVVVDAFRFFSLHFFFAVVTANAVEIRDYWLLSGKL